MGKSNSDKSNLALLSCVAFVAILAIISMSSVDITQYADTDVDALTGASVASISGMAVACLDNTICRDDQLCKVSGKRCTRKVLGRCKQYREVYSCIAKQSQESSQPSQQPQSPTPTQQASPAQQPVPSPLPLVSTPQQTPSLQEVSSRDVVFQGAPPLQACSDSDGGLVLDKGGAIKLTFGRMTPEFFDRCTDTKFLVEYECRNNNPREVTYDCSKDNKICRDGACQKPDYVIPTCRDSDGIHNAQKGTVTTVDSATGKEILFTDYCSDSSTLKEYYCKDLTSYKYDIMEIHCSEGPCVDGACTHVTQSKDLGEYCIRDEDCKPGLGLKCDINKCKLEERGKCSKEEDCLSGLKCDSGICQKVTCTDSDNGMNPPDKGGILTITTTRMGTYQLPDTCADDTTVNEQVCNLNNFIYFDKKPVKCPLDKPRCHDGECGAPAAVVKYCNDGDGDYLFTKAIVRYNDNSGKEIEFWDSCVDDETVIEGKCDAQGTNFLCTDPSACKKKCDPGFLCKDGACTKSPESCDDSDMTYADRSKGDDADLRQKGAVRYVDKKGSAGSFVDSCASQTSVTEGFCDGLIFKSNAVTCPQGTLCKEGACMPYTPSCTDSDGNDLYTVGKISYVDQKGEHVESDKCFSDAMIDEKVCQGVLSSTTTVSCPTASKCVNGVCTKPVVTTQPSQSVFIQCGNERCYAATQQCKQVGEKCIQYRRTWRGRVCVRREPVYSCVAK